MAKKIPKKIKGSPRYLALTTLERVAKEGAYSNLLLNQVMKQASLSAKDGGLYTEIVYGTLSRQRLLAYYLQPFLERAKKLDDWVRQLLMLSVYQLEFLDKIPDHAVLNEAVEIAKAKGNGGIGKFVNGVLRNFLRQGPPSTAAIPDPIERLAIEISLPVWLTTKLIQQIGLDETRKLGQSLVIPSRASARIVTSRITREDAIVQLLSEGIQADLSRVSPDGVVAEKGSFAKSSLFSTGQLTIQDESSMLVAPSMRIEAHMQVLDACAAPGGKTTHIAAFLDATKGGRVTALDIHEHKLKLVEENAARLGVEEVIRTKKLDARETHQVYEKEMFDRVLVDAPCSGLGLMRRKPDIRYHKQPKDFFDLQKIQLEILESVAPVLKPSGLLTYSTCTITLEENQQVIEKFLHKHPEFEIIDVQVPGYIASAVTQKMLVLYPHQFMTDGFFICCLRKK